MHNITGESLSPLDLLKNAKSLFLSGKEEYLRPAVLKAISCLESYVQTVVFRELESRIDPLLLKWLQDKTSSDFDSRLSILIPTATGLQVDKRSELWDRYKKAKLIRNRVTHVGIRVTQEQAKFVIDMVEAWLTYLASTVSLQLQLEVLRKEVESGVVKVTNKKAALELIREHLSPLGDLYRTEAANQGMIDAVFAVGQYRVAVSIAFIDLRTLKALKNIHADSSGLPDTFSHGVSLVFNRGVHVPDEVATKTSGDGRVITLIINSERDGIGCSRAA